MYSFVDQPVDQLAAGSRFILERMRDWLATLPRAADPAETQDSPFPRLAMRPVLEDFHGLMLELDREGRLASSFGKPGQAWITGMEAVLLALWSDAMADRGERVRGVLHLLLVEPAIERAMVRLARVASRLVGLRIAPTGIRSSGERRSEHLRDAR
ncbi:hypothetical protein GG804_22385 [Sphingomonas histidinilytica]|uniref:hypothetical protein n=1 Tax=Rhizorhabdus histidinilytica TaxID=439228 RepID=UPI001ADD3660|nr:hypothetical protein [Rhizorhabdus histidinilytica]MBO9379524.1 hypothetical protein [Rhizorhabdus histidinilytica]